MANLDRIRALVAFRPIRATKMGMSIFIFSFIRTRTGKSSFFFNRPRAGNSRGFQTVNFHFHFLNLQFLTLLGLLWDLQVQSLATVHGDLGASKNSLW